MAPVVQGSAQHRVTIAASHNFGNNRSRAYLSRGKAWSGVAWITLARLTVMSGEVPPMTKQRQIYLKSFLRRHAHELVWAGVLTAIAIVALIATGFRAT